MANSYIEYTSGLTGTTFSVPFKYISIDDVQALGFDGEKYVPLTISSRNASAKTITLSTAPSAYEKLRLYRATSNTQLVDFQNGSRLSERDLDTAYQQGLFAAQEISEDASTAQFAAIRERTLQVGTSLSNFASEEFTGDGTSTVFDITAFNTQTTVNEAYRVSIDGVMQSPIDAYSVSMNPSKITFASAPPSGSKIVVVTAASAASAVSVDDVTIGLTSTNKAEVKDGAVTPSKLSTGAPQWDTNGMVLVGLTTSPTSVPNSICCSGRIVTQNTYNQTTSSSANVHIDSGGFLIRSTSSKRYKENINDYEKGIEAVKSLRPVTYESINEDDDNTYAGFIAEEVHDAGLSEFVEYNDEGQPDALHYSHMTAVLTKALQEALTKIETLEARVEALENA